MTERFTRSRDALGDLYTVWYADQDDRFTGYADSTARPLRIWEAAKLLDGWPRARRLAVERFEDRFRTAGEDVQLVLPAYRVQGGDALLLDGTHRAVAAYRSAVSARLLVFTVHGPLDESVLPDLRHHSA